VYQYLPPWWSVSLLQRVFQLNALEDAIFGSGMPQERVILSMTISCTFFGMTFKVLIGLFYLPNSSIIINYDFSEVRVNITIG